MKGLDSLTGVAEKLNWAERVNFQDRICMVGWFGLCGRELKP